MSLSHFVLLLSIAGSLPAADTPSRTMTAPVAPLESHIFRESTARKSTGDWGFIRIYTPDVTMTQGTDSMLTAELEFLPGERLQPPHRHPEEEWQYVISGHGTWTLHDEEIPLQPGDLMYAKPGDLHGIANTSSEPLKFLVVKWRSRIDRSAEAFSAGVNSGLAVNASAFPLPPINEEVPLPEIKEICAHYGLTALWQKIERDPPPRPFKSDGCTGWLDDWKGVSLYPAGFLHDLKYWAGYPGEDVERLAADAELMIDVARLLGSTAMAETMFHGVRLGGTDKLKASFSWGFGRNPGAARFPNPAK
jgi:mannose-6-phosphate isomerase-like protein (cupin superfamily)